MTSAGSSWSEIVTSSRGRYSFDVQNLTSGAAIRHHQDLRMETASVIKLPILIALLLRVQAGELSLRQQMHLTRDQVGRNGSGLLQSMYFTAPLPLYNLAFLMMSVSDNVATNAIIDLLGFNTLNDLIKDRLLLDETRLVMKKLDFPPRYVHHPGNEIGISTAAEMTDLVTRLHRGQILDTTHTKLALRFMRRIQGSTFQRSLPSTKVGRFGSKTGWIGMDREPHITLCESGYVQHVDGDVLIFSVFSEHPKSKLSFGVDAPERLEFARLARTLCHELIGKSPVINSKP